MPSVYVVKPGLLTTVQDRGRWGSQSLGVSVSGPMDSYSHRLANAIAGNDAGAATLEVTLSGPELEFDDTRTVAVTGAEFELSVDGRPVAMRSALDVGAGSVLRFGRRVRGTRAYVAISGGITTPRALGSRSTHLPSALGGLDGRALRAGDRLPLGEPLQSPRPVRRSQPVESSSTWTLPDGRATLRVLPGPQLDRFVRTAWDVLQSAPYVVANDSNRIGYRLVGPSLETPGKLDLISDATPLGVLQVPPSGQPILLMADCQTTGGYPKIAAVISADVSVAGQLGPGDTVRFVACSTREALSALIAQERSLMAAARS
ncbi:MAG TPA: biotin-dependent carboxyltransferase family protein [Vicinamibacterales bacterium]|nr:biotin-dependent carboxyltransferase family protein [Vicinamibacterales bacterium]